MMKDKKKCERFFVKAFFAFQTNETLKTKDAYFETQRERETKRNIKFRTTKYKN